MGINFKRKNAGGGPNWGAGWDDLFSEFWDDLDRMCEDNYYGRHNEGLINKVFTGMKIALEKSLQRMEKYNQLTRVSDDGWTKGAKEILTYFLEAKSISDKVIAINSTEQFLRATDPSAKEVKQILGEEDV